MLRKLFIIAFLLIIPSLTVAAQQQEEEETAPVKWSLETEKISAALKRDDKFNAFLTAKLEKGWHLYALEKIEGGPIATRITIGDESPFQLGSIEAPKPIETEDSAFGVTTKFYEDSVMFTLPIKVLQTIDSAALQVKVRFQICNDEVCLPPKTVIVKTAAQNSASEK
jgi:thiol:disulfide interchange protein DsbD